MSIVERSKFGGDEWNLNRADILELDTHGYDINRFTPTIQRALRLAAYAHEGDRRKLADMPFLAHPFETMLIVAEIQGIDPYCVAEDSDDEVSLAVALLHDTDEDSQGRVSIAMIREIFGERVASGVSLATRDKNQPSSVYIDKLTHSNDKLGLRGVAADKSHALTCRIPELYKLGADPVDKFNGTVAEKVQYYITIYNALKPTLGYDDPMMLMYRELIVDYAGQIQQILGIDVDLSALTTHDACDVVN